MKPAIWSPLCYGAGWGAGGSREPLALPLAGAGWGRRISPRPGAGPPPSSPATLVLCPDLGAPSFAAGE